MKEMVDEIQAFHEAMMQKALDEAQIIVRGAALEGKTSCQVSPGNIGVYSFLHRLQEILGDKFKVDLPREGEGLTVIWTIPLSVVYRPRPTSGWGD